jgi:hypothetical protein
MTSRTVLAALGLLAGISSAASSECARIRDEDLRRQCLAEERQDPDTCTGIGNADDRALCRERAGQRSLEQ